MTRDALIALARDAAARWQLYPALVCAVCEQESSWDPWAIRFEPEFERRYIRPALPSAPTTEELTLAMSWGLMQVMGQTAREHGFSGRFLAKLCAPPAGLDIGCKVLAHKLALAEGNVVRALLLWNGGAHTNYAVEVLARAERYKQGSESSTPSH